MLERPPLPRELPAKRAEPIVFHRHPGFAKARPERHEGYGTIGSCEVAATASARPDSSAPLVEPGDTLVAHLEEGRLDLALIPRTLVHAAFRFCS